MYKKNYILYDIVIASVNIGISGESSGDDVTFDPEQQKVDYFELKSSVDTAIQLQPLVRGSNSAMSILTGALYACTSYI